MLIMYVGIACARKYNIDLIYLLENLLQSRTQKIEENIFINYSIVFQVDLIEKK